MRSGQNRTAWGRVFLALIGVILLSEAGFSEERHENCPFCTAASQTLRQELQSMDAIAIGRLETDGRKDIDGQAEFKIEKVLSGENLLKVDQAIQATYFGPGRSAKKFLLMGVDPRDLVWSSPLPLTADGEKYIEKIRSLPDNPVERLAFYQQYFEHADSMLARDCYDEFALAPYSDVVLLKDKMDREQLLKWVQDPSKSPDRKRLYYTMLGICGKPEDAKTFESLITSPNPEARAGLDALLAAYLTIKGESGLKLIEDRFFHDKETQYADIYSAVMALRFHGTEINQLPKESITKTMHHLLDRPELADLVIPDLARWGDWSQLDRLTEMFEKANDENSWVKVPVINYLRACPLPEAKEKLAKLEKLDPAAIKRAKTFFPIPTPAAPKKNDSSYIPPKAQKERALVVDRYRKDIRLASLDSYAFLPRQFARNSELSVANTEFTPIASVRLGEDLNLWAPMTVVVIATVMLGLVMWTIATSGGSRLNPLPVSRRI
jgi:hypothetical protein